MKNFGRLTLAGALTLLTFTVPARATNNDRGVCSNATLKGAYAFTISGTIFIPNAPPTLIQGVALTHFDGTTDGEGNGKLSQVDFVVSHPQLRPPAPGPLEFENDEIGTYRVSADCTGKATIRFKLSGQVNELMLVISSHGRNIHTVVSSLMITDPTSRAEITIPAVIHSDAEKVDPENW